jgi:hypothetical protein
MSGAEGTTDTRRAPPEGPVTDRKQVLSLVLRLMNRELAGFSLSLQKSARRQGLDADRA